MADSAIYLFLDESGDFLEAGDEQSSNRGGFSSQLAGFFTTAELPENLGQDAVVRLLRAAKLEQQSIKSSELRREDKCTLAPVLCELLEEKGWHPVRLTNLERVALGGRQETYLTMLGELACRLLEQQSAVTRGSVTLNLLSASVTDHEGRDWKPEAYRAALGRALNLAAVHRGQARAASTWKLGRLELGSARKDPRLQLCDLISNLSHADFHALDESGAARLRKTLARHDYTLQISGLEQEVRRELDGGFLGSASVRLVEAATRAALPVAPKLTPLTEELIGALARRPARRRDTHLAQLCSWLEQVIEDRRDGQLGLQAIDWLEENLVAPLMAGLRPTQQGELDWLIFVLRRLAMTAANHLGKLTLARDLESKLEQAGGPLIGRLEHLPIVMDWRLAAAVHETDQLRFERALEHAGCVRRYAEGLETLRDELLEGWGLPTPETGRFELLGRALGTLAQAQAFSALHVTERSRREQELRDAVQTSEQAEACFSGESDQARQWQYQAQFLGYLGDFAEARARLARALGTKDSTHEGLASALKKPKELDHFLLSHWLRLGSRAASLGNAEELSSFRNALRALGSLDKQLAELRSYPVHAILRHLAVVRAATRDPKGAERALKMLRELYPLEQRANVLALIQLAAELEVAALAPSSGAHARAARNSLKNSCLALTSTLKRRSESGGLKHFARLMGVTEELINGVLEGEAEPRELLELARRVPY